MPPLWDSATLDQWSPTPSKECKPACWELPCLISEAVTPPMAKAE